MKMLIEKDFFQMKYKYIMFMTPLYFVHNAISWQFPKQPITHL